MVKRCSVSAQPSGHQPGAIWIRARFRPCFACVIQWIARIHKRICYTGAHTRALMAEMLDVVSEADSWASLSARVSADPRRTETGRWPRVCCRAKRTIAFAFY